MKTIKDINEELDSLATYMFLNSDIAAVIELFRKRLCRLTKSEEKMITHQFSLEMFIETLPFIVHSINFFKNNTINLPSKFKQDLVLKYLSNYDQLVSSTEDMFVHYSENLDARLNIHST